MRTRFVTIGAVLLVTVLASLVLVAPGAPEPARVAATLRLDWVPGAHHIGPILAAKRGYYAREGLDLEVKPGKGSSSTVQLVATGGDLFGFADAGVMALAISRGAPVVMVANPTPVGANGAITIGVPMTSPKDYEGKKIGLVPGESSHAILQALLKKYNIPETSYRVIAVEASSKVPALLAGKVDTIPGFRFGDFLRAYTQNPDTKIKLFSDWGINVLGNGYLVTTKTLAEKPDLVRGFVRATIRGWTDTIADPTAGVDALLAAFPDTNRRFAELGLPLVIEHMHTPATSGKPLGWMSEEDWKATIDLLKTTGLEGDRPLSAYYRNMVE
jgi:NitT/TauT family transport system substrate-binding protein